MSSPSEKQASSELRMMVVTIDKYVSNHKLLKNKQEHALVGDPVQFHITGNRVPKSKWSLCMSSLSHLELQTSISVPGIEEKD